MREIKVLFGDVKVKEAFDALEKGKSADPMIYKAINRAIDNLKLNPKCGEQMAKRLIPKYYVGIDNLWWYDITKDWRLFYTLKGNEMVILAIILEWMNHKNYERRFGYG